MARVSGCAGVESWLPAEMEVAALFAIPRETRMFQVALDHGWLSGACARDQQDEHERQSVHEAFDQVSMRFLTVLSRAATL
jgi:hypothetical protein